MTATTILSEVGWDTSKWETEDHFVSWLRLCPDNRISGNRVIGTGRLSINNRVTMAFKMAASSLRLSDTYLGAQFRTPYSESMCESEPGSGAIRL